MPITRAIENKRSNKNVKNKLKKSRDDPDSDNESISLGEEDSDDYETVSEEDDDSDSEYIPPKKHSKKSAKKRAPKESDEEEEEEFDKKQFHKLISSMFPSKYMSKKVEEEDSESDEDDRRKPKRRSKKYNKKAESEEEEEEDDRRKPKRRSKKYNKRDESESESEAESETESEEDDSEEDESGQKFNIIFTMDNPQFQDEEEALEEETDDCNSEDEETFMKDTYEKMEAVETGKKQKSIKRSEKKETKKSEATVTTPTDVEDQYRELVELQKTLIEKLKKSPKSRILARAVKQCKSDIRKLVKKSRMKNTKAYYKLLHEDTKKTNELDYFKRKLSNKEQHHMMTELKEINSHMQITKPYRLSLLETSMPAKYKATVLQKLNVLQMMDPSDPEYYKIKNWVDTFMRVPFSVYKSLTVRMSDGIEACSAFMERSKRILDECVYGLDDAKMQIMQMVGQWIANPSAMGTAIAINGPPGTGKTTLIKDGISKILGREFAFLALGGAGDASFLEGHSYTYEGSSWGKIVQILIDSKCMNPVIYFDELDKISETPRGEEIVGILTHLTDTTQNTQYHDKYFSEIDFDLSKCLFIFSYNDESKVNPILKDRMYRIHTKGYDANEKVTIAKQYMLPKIREQVAFGEDEVVIPDETLKYIISNQAITMGEKGVRNLKRCLEIIHTKLNLFRLVRADNNMFAKDIELDVTFPFTVTKKAVDALIKNEEHQNQSLLAMYV
jgi:ATP-dependent Lon protease